MDRMTDIHPAMKDYYTILGVLPTAEAGVIGAAYRELAKKYHPDKWRGDRSVGEAKMRELNEAYAQLSNELRRREYDRDFNRRADYNFTKGGPDLRDTEKSQPPVKPFVQQEEMKKGTILLGLTVTGFQIALRLFVYGALAFLAIAVLLSVLFQLTTGR